MTEYYGDFAEDDTVLIPFNTFDSNDPSASVTITNLADADIKVHKDGSLTQIVTDGATVVIDFDSITGNHMITIDTSAHADYSTGSEYAVRIEGTTVDGATINGWVGAFSIERAGGALALIKAGVTLAAGAITDASLAGNMEVVFETDFGTNYNVTTNAWETNLTDTIGTLATADFAADFLTEALIADNAIAAEHLAAAAIDNATFAADVGSTAYATNIIALAVRKALDEIKLDHLIAVADADDVVDNSVIAKLVSKSATANWSDFVNTTDSLQNIRDELVVVDGNVDDIETALAAGVDMASISGSTAGADRLELSTLSIIPGTAETGTLSTTQMSSNLAEATDDHYIGRTIIWTSGVLIGQATDITDYTGVAGVLTYSAVTEAPSNNDTFIII